MQTVEQMAKFIQSHREQDHDQIRTMLGELRNADVVEVLNALPLLGDAAEMLALVPLSTAIGVCEESTLRRRTALIEQADPALAAKILEGMAADQRTDVIRGMSLHGRRLLLPLLSPGARAEVEQLLTYPERTAGDLMTTEFVRLAPTMTVAEALAHVRIVACDRESIYACYILEPKTERLLGAVSLRDLVMADGARTVGEVMRPNPVTVPALLPQREVAQKVSKYNLLAVPVVETDGRVVGFVTVDDVIDAMIDEQTGSVLRMGAVDPEMLDLPYMNTPFLTLVRVRATWLVILFLGEMLTATAMGHFEEEIQAAVVLALFVPLIISSGGNSGSQATTLVIRALALSELRLRNWARVLGRELCSGLALGAILGSIGFIRIAVWQYFNWHDYGRYWIRVGLTVSLSLVGIVLWGTISGSMLPFILKRLGLDPATSSAPFVATLVDVTGLIIYFSVANVILRGTLL